MQRHDAYSVNVYSSELPTPSEKLHHRQVQQPTVSSTTNSTVPDYKTSAIVGKGATSVVDDLGTDDIVIDGVEPTLIWHNEQFDKHHRQAMIRLVYVAVLN